MKRGRTGRKKRKKKRKKVTACPEQEESKGGGKKSALSHPKRVWGEGKGEFNKRLQSIREWERRKESDPRSSPEKKRKKPFNR